MISSEEEINHQHRHVELKDTNKKKIEGMWVEKIMYFLVLRPIVYSGDIFQENAPKLIGGLA